MKKGNIKSIVLMSIAILALVVVCSVHFVKNTMFIDKNEDVLGLASDNTNFTAIIKTNNGEFGLEALDVIEKASELLGSSNAQRTTYSQSSDFGRGVNVNYGQTIVSESNIKDASSITGIDCSGLIYWSLSSLAKEQGISFNTTSRYGNPSTSNTKSNLSSGFGMNNPVPPSTFYWLMYDYRGYYFKETGWSAASSSKFVSECDLKIFGKSVNVLKANQTIKDNLEYYEYIDEQGNKQKLPAGTIVIVNNLKMDDNLRTNVDDHSWICIGDLGTTDASVAREKLIAMGIPAERLRVGDSIISESSTNTYWRIESKGGYGVYINNNDARQSTTYKEVINGEVRVKAVGPIWAFQIANDCGEYQLNVEKVDENGKAIPLSKNIFEVKVNENKLNGIISNKTNNRVEFETQYFKEADINDPQKQIETVTIREIETPGSDYGAYDKTIRLKVKKINKQTNTGSSVLTVKPIELTILDKNDNILKTYSESQLVNGNFLYDDGNVHLDLSNNTITIKIKNKKINGSYDLNIFKTDSNGNYMSGATFNAQSTTRVNGSLANNWNSITLSGTSGIYKAEPVQITNTNVIDVIQITEQQAPTGYEKFDKKVILQISKKEQNSKYVIDTVAISVLDKDTEVTEDVIGNGTVILNASRQSFVDSDNNLEIRLANNNTAVNVKIENRKVDLALKKSVIRVNDKEVTKVNGFNEDRFLYKDSTNKTGYNCIHVDASTLNDTTNARYMMNKQPVAVSIGDEVQYSIRIYNEGEVKAKASKINDYIPQGLRVIRATYGDVSLPCNVVNGVLSLDLDVNNSFIEEFDKNSNNAEPSYDEVIVTCVVENNASGVLTNVAEITEYKTQTGVITNDIDSTSNNWQAAGNENKLANSKNSDSWRNYGKDASISTWSEDNLVQDEGLNGNKGDDDDFDKLIVNNIDLALKKVITQVNDVNGNSQNIKRPQITDYSWIDISPLNNGKTDALYNMNKTPILLYRGSEVTYRLYVFNEGQTDAKALDITDYIPVGLEVRNVYYKDNIQMVKIDEADIGLSSVLNENYENNYYSYKKNNGVLYIHLGDDSADILPAFNGTTLSKDYITVKCVVKDNAEGILTNIAEISTYVTRNAEVTKDIDSYSDNWKSPTGSGKVVADKSSALWRNYIKGSGKLDDNYYQSFIGTKYDLSSGKEDDDDFEKVKVLDTYKVAIQKVSGQDSEQSIENIEFSIKYKDETPVNKFTDSNGKIDVVEKVVNYTVNTDEEDVFYIQEVSIPSGVTYSKINTKFELRIKKVRNSNGADVIEKYAFIVSNGGTGQIRYKSLPEETILTVNDSEGNPVDVIARYDSETNTFVITIPNNAEKKNYEFKLIKVNNKINESDVEDGIEGITFSCSSSVEYFRTDANGRISFGVYPIDLQTYQNDDEFVITELEDSQNRYYQLAKPITVKVRKGLNTGNASFFVDGISLNGSEFTRNSISKEVSLKNTSKKVTITLSLESNVVTLKVPNILKDGKYSLVVIKQDKNGNELTSAQTGFSLTDGNDEVLTVNGRAQLITEKSISADELGENGKDSYTISEVTAPDGYVRLAKSINLDVYKADNGEKFVVSKVYAYIDNGSYVTVQKGEFGWLNNVELIDGTKVNVLIDLQTDDVIQVFVPNNELSGKFNIEIYKYSMENGIEIKVPNIDFTIIKSGLPKASTRTTNNDGIAYFNKISINGSSVDTYELTEGKLNSDTRYIGIADKIRFSTVTGKSSDGSRYELLDAYFENGTKNTTVTLMNGKTITIQLELIRNSNGINVIRFNLENPPIKGRYMVKLVKVINNNNQNTQYLNGVTFKVKENGATESALYETVEGGKVKIADKVITYNDVNDIDEYLIEEIRFSNNNKYVKLKYPLTLKVEKSKNKYGEDGTESAPGTKFVVSKVQLIGQGNTSRVSSSKIISSNEDSITLTNIALEDGSLVDIVANLTEETDSLTGDKVQLIELTIPNTERSGSYEVKLRKVDEKGGNVSNATFKVENTINGVVQASRITDRTVGGYTSLGSVILNAETLNTTDTFKISEVNIYKSSNSDEVQIGYAKLASPVTLSVTKDVSGNKFVVSSMSLSQEGKETVVSTSGSVTLRNADLEYNYKADITAKLVDNTITITIPNQEITGGYSLNLIKTRDNFTQKMQNAIFKYTGNQVGERTDVNGEIVIVDSYKINKSNVNIVDNYEIKEVENKTNYHLELGEPINISVEKGKDNDKFVVTKVTITAANQSKSIVTGGTNIVQIDGIKTVKNGVTTSAKLSFDESTQKITLTVDNPPVDGEYTLKIKKVDSRDDSRVLQGVQFNAIQSKIVTSGGPYENVKEINSTTQSDGYAYIVGDNPYTIQIEDKEKINKIEPETWYISEISTLENYKLLDKVKIDLSFNKKLSDDGKSYIIDANSVELSVLRNDDTDEAYDMQEYLRKSIDKYVSDDGTEIAIILPNDSLATYGFKVVKNDENGNALSGSLFTIIDYNEDTLLSNQYLPNDNGSSYIKEYPNVVPNTTYKFEVIENASSNTYENLLHGFKLDVSVKLDEMGNVDIGESKIEVIPLSDDYDRNAYIKLNNLIRNRKIKLSLGVNNTAVLTIINEKITSDYSLKLLKTEMGYNSTLAGAEFSVKKDGEDLTYFTTQKNVACVIDSDDNVKADSEIVYEIEEISAPENYTKIFAKLEVIVNVDDNGNTSARISRFHPGAYNSDWLNYDESVQGHLVKLERDGNTNNYIIKWANNSKFSFVLVKEGYTADPVYHPYYSKDLIATESGQEILPRISGANISIAEGNSDGRIYTSGYNLIGQSYVTANTEYIYTIKELSPANNYINDFDGIIIRAHIRTDENVRLIEADQNRKYQASYYEIIDTTGTKSEIQLAEIESKVCLKVFPDTQTAKFFMVNTAVPQNSTYNLTLFKEDDATHRKLKNAEFEIRLNDGNSTTVLDSDADMPETQNFKTDENGMIKISDIPFTLNMSNQIHTFEIREVAPPSGYIGLGTAVVTATVDLSNKFYASDITRNDITVNVSSGNSNIIGYDVYDDGEISLTIPNTGKTFKISVRKIDTNNDLISASYINNVKQGSKVSFKLTDSASAIIDGNQYFEDGEATYTQDRDESSIHTYVYELSEIAAKYGYSNVFADYEMFLFVKLDNDGNVIDVNPDDLTDIYSTHCSFMKVHSTTDVTYEEVKEFVKLKVVTDSDGTKRVILDLVNPNEYKLRLRKTDTDGNLLDKARIKAYLIEDGVEVEKAELDGTSESKTDSVMIKEGETQTWVIDEIEVDKPYINILDGNKKLYVTAKIENKNLVYDYEVHDIVDGNQIVLARSNSIYDLIDVEVNQEADGYILDVKLKNPSGLDFILIKTNINDDETTSSAIQVNEVTNINGTDYNSTIEINERSLKIGDEKTYVISELSCDEPFVNILGNNKLFIKAKVVSAYDVVVSGIGYIDENDVTHNGTFGPFERYISVPDRFVVNRETKLPTMVVRLRNPIQYKVRVYKVDSNDNTIKNADFQLVDQAGNIYKNRNNDYIEISRIATIENESKFFTIRENASAFGYNNDFENKDIYFNAKYTSSISSSANSTVKVASTYLKNRITGESIYDSEVLNKYYTYEIVKENGIPVIIVKIKNTTEYNLNIVKQNTNEIEYNGAQFELYEVDENTNDKTLVANNIVNNQKKANITLNNISILPNKLYTYSIKEVSTEAPHVNILDDDKEVRLSVRILKDDVTDRLSFEYNYDILDKNGNVLVNDPSREFITFRVEQNEETGKYTLNMYIQNPIQFNMKFRKTDMDGNEITGKASITINNIQNNGSKDEVYNNLKVGDEVSFLIKETAVDSPFVNILPNDSSIIITAKVMDNEKIEIIDTKFVDNSSDESIEKDISEIAEFFSYELVQVDGIQTLDMELKNPMEYKVKILKKDMAGFGLEGANIVATYNGQTYSNEGRDYIEIPVKNQSKGDITTIYINEKDSKENYKNIFGSNNTIEVQFKVNDNYELEETLNSRVLVVHTSGRVSVYRTQVPSDYFDVKIDNMVNNQNEITAEVILKNPIEYDIEFVKQDLSGNEISGDGLTFQVTRNSDSPISNNGNSTINFSEKKLSPNTVNTYIIEELETIAPHVNELAGKKAIVEVRVDEDGNIITSTPVITDNQGNIYENKVVFVEPNIEVNNGKRTVKVVLENPMTYRFKLTKTTTPTKELSSSSEPTKKPINGVSIQVNDISNINGVPQIDFDVNDVKVGDTKLFVIKENSVPAPYDNLLENKEIRLVTIMGSDKKLHFVSEILKDTTTGESVLITNEIKEQYRFDYEFVTGDDGIETLEVNIENPIKFNVKVVKKDATGITELSGTDIELLKGNTIIASNKDTGSAVLQYTAHNVGPNDSWVFRVNENSSVSPNQNIVLGKTIVMPIVFSHGNLVNYSPMLINTETGEIESNPKFISVHLETIDGIRTIILELENPVDYSLDISKNAAGVGFLQNTKFKVYREDADEAIFDGYVKDINTWKTAEVEEHNMNAGRYTYYITETRTARQRYINILDGKYIKLNVQVSGTGKVTIMNNNWEEDENYFEVYEGNISDRKDTDVLVNRNDDIYNDIDISTLIDVRTRKYTVHVDVTNPLKYMVELEKYDTAGEKLSGAEFEIVSSLIDEQNAEKTEMNKTIGVDNVAEDGTVTGTTGSQGIISFEETHVYAGTYEYELRETQTPGKQYVNPIEGYTVHFKVSVAEDGNLKLEFYENGKKCYIEKDGEEATDELYKYVFLAVDNNTIIAKLQIQLENPVRFRFIINKDIYGDENISLGNAEFKVESSIVKEQRASYRTILREIGITDVTESGIISAITNSDGIIGYDETMVSTGIYEYWISEIENGNQYIVNLLKDKYIKVYVKVDSDGTIHTVSKDGQIIDGKYYLYERDKVTEINFADTCLDELIKVEINDNSELNVLNVLIDNPEFYDVSLIKIDKDTNERMDEIKFKVNTYIENDEGEKVPVNIKHADDITKFYDTNELVTGVVEGEHGCISIDGILIEKAGTYYYEFVEETPQEPVIYKNKVENVVVKVVIDVEEINGQRQYVVTDKEVVQGENYVVSSESDTNNVEVEVSNERVKGSYNIEIDKIEELLGGPVVGAKFTVKALKENKELNVEDEFELYKSTDDVNSRVSIIPTEFTIDEEDGKFMIENIRIEKPETYVIEIKETEAPETYTLLRDVIRLRITTGIEGENDNAKYVLKSVELDGKDNDGLVSISNTNDKININATNNQFDLSLRKFITSINGKDVTRWSEPEVDTSKLISGEQTTAEYYNYKMPLRVYAGQEIIYTLRVYNEGQIAGYANTIVDHLPEQLEFLPDDEFNKERRWTYVEDDENKRTIKTDYLSKYVGEEVNLIKPFDTQSGELDYVEVQVKCKVKENVKSRTYITNIAEITEYEGKDRPNVIDRDNSNLLVVPSDEELPEYKQNEIYNDYVPGQEDDDDFEKIIVEEFDLALRKFITHVNEKEITSRVPVFKVDEDGNYYYEHDKTPLVVAHDNLVEYTIRIYNEGTVSGYANLVKDDIPEGLVFVKDNEINEQFGWVMLDENGKQTNDVTKAKFIETDYLSKEKGESANLIKSFNSNIMTEPDYRDLKVVFKVDVPVRRDDVIVNEAQISDDRDDYGREVEDKDSTPDEWIDGEDDQDVEYIKVKYFDLALYKWVSTAIVTQDGKTTEYESNHTQSDKSNMVNVTIPKDKVNDVIVKFRYIIKVENQGNLPGYAKEIKDHIPAGLKFMVEDNAEYGWVSNGQGIIVTDYLKDTLLNEGDTVEIPVVLTWINGSDNLGQKFNYAEISEDYNDYGSPDVDSTPDNFEITPKEDDEDGDVVLLEIKTGEAMPIYLFVVLAAVMIVIAGVIGIKKFVLNKE